MLINSPSLPVTASSANVLMIRRKDSMSFAEFMRGKYDPLDSAYVATLFRNMTLKEQSLIACEPFEVLWKQLWGDDRASVEFTLSREKFKLLDRRGLMITNLSPYTEPEWGFPKGRRVRGESDLDCAIREFTEETNVPREAYTVVKNILLEETFVGLNGVQYKHLYFVAMLREPDMINISQKFTPMQRREISAIAWKSLEEADALIRPHHIERAGMLDQLRSAIETFETG